MSNPAAVLFLFVITAVLGESLYKKLAGPPSEFQYFGRPSPFAAAQLGSSLILPELEIGLLNENEKFTIPVDSCRVLIVSIYHDHGLGNHFKAVFLSPNGSVITVDKAYNGEYGINTGGMFPVSSYMFLNPAIGTWTVQLKWKLFNSSGTPNLFSGKIIPAIAFDESSTVAWTALKDENLLIGQRVTIEAMIPIPGTYELNRGHAIPLTDHISEAELTLKEPNGKFVNMKMNDEANDGLFDAYFTAVQPGIYDALIQLQGKDSQGNSFARSLWYLFTIVEPSLNLTGSSSAHMYTHSVTNDDLINIDVGVEWDTKSDDKYRGFAQVWGTSTSGNESMVPVAWVSGLIDVQKGQDSKFFLRFELNSNWLHLAKAKVPLELRNLTVDETKTFISVVMPTNIPVNQYDDRLKMFEPINSISKISYEMRNGFNVYRHKYSDFSETGALILVHGYCSSDCPFTKDEFTDYAVFEDYKQSRTNMEFSQKILDFANDNGITKFSTVAHSHGGIATLNLFTYFQSGYDATTSGGRKLQSIGTPYFGNPFAGFIASLGSVLGIGCGTNDDLTYDSANRWLSKIPPEAQSEVYFYATEYKDNWLLDRFCFPGASAFLSRPNDGVAEISKTKLPYGHHIGDYIGECHTVFMRWPPQCQDSSRNKEINANAAR